ncbi:hypothetical protein ACFUGD_26415 [Streptomyces sp. NPDC057217]|uniref:LppU/SCO3897 family protein n=1 Tax=Streptomyces sp. NPDC057217 TaxID=3346054 RepID=UPI0036436BD2
MTFPHPHAQPHPPPHPQQYPHPSAPPLPQQYGYAPGPPPMPGCEVCGARPATAVTVRAHQGMIIIMRTVTRRGVFCRTCGLAVYRQMTSDTLLTGWWGLFSFFVTPFVVLGNAFGARAALRRLPEPYGAVRPRLHPGRRVLRRAPAMLILTPIALVALAVPTLVVVGLLSGGGDGSVALSAGDCVRNEVDWPEQQLRKVDCGSPLAEYRVLDEASCGPGDYLLRAEYTIGAPGRPGSCVTPL